MSLAKAIPWAFILEIVTWYLMSTTRSVLPPSLVENVAASHQTPDT
jgi:hypothetical protein